MRILVLLIAITGGALAQAQPTPTVMPPQGQPGAIQLAPGVVVPPGGVPVPINPQQQQQMQGQPNQIPPQPVYQPGFAPQPQYNPGFMGGGGGGGVSASTMSYSGGKPAAPPCDVKLSAPAGEAPALGGFVEFKATLAPANCEPDLGVSSSWTRLTAASAPGVVRVAVDPNPERVPRQSRLVIGGQTFSIVQDGLKAPRVAASPGRLTFGLRKDKELKPRTIKVWSTEPATLAVSTTAPWLVATAAPAGKGEGRTFKVTVNRASLPRGQRAEAVVRIAAGEGSMDVPVVVEPEISR